MSLRGQRCTAVPTIDLATMRETIAFMHDDLRGSGKLAAVYAALGKVLQAIDEAQDKSVAATGRAADPRVVAFPTAPPCFVPWSAG